MQAIRCLTVAVIALLAAGCSSFTSEKGATLPRNAQWGVLPLVNYSQAPQAGERAEQILVSVLAGEGVRAHAYAVPAASAAQLLDEQDVQGKALEWARQQNLAYVVTGSVEEWQYKNGLDGEPAVGVSLRVIEPASGRVLWSSSGARAGWSRESLAGAAQKVLRELVDDMRLE